jgi:hypothetical protein
VKVQGVHIQQVKLETDEGGMGDHNDVLMCQKNLQLRRLQKRSQPWEQLDAVIEEIMGLMIQSAKTASKERLSRRRAAVAAAAVVGRWSRWKAPKTYLGSRSIPTA